MKSFTSMLIGMQLIGWDDGKKILTVKDRSKLFDLVFDDSDEGDCCGYNVFFAELFTSEEDLAQNPIITRVEVEKNVECDEEKAKITFFGGAKKLLKLESLSSSGSGWTYGACVTVRCKAMELDEVVTEW